jgi:hypothetical protein
MHNALNHPVNSYAEGEVSRTPCRYMLQMPSARALEPRLPKCCDASKQVALHAVWQGFVFRFGIRRLPSLCVWLQPDVCSIRSCACHMLCLQSAALYSFLSVCAKGVSCLLSAVRLRGHVLHIIRTSANWLKLVVVGFSPTSLWQAKN